MGSISYFLELIHTWTEFSLRLLGLPPGLSLAKAVRV